MKTGPVLCDDESIDRKLSRLPMNSQFESICQELLKHRLRLKSALVAAKGSQLIGDRAICLCFDVESFRVKPLRASQNPRLRDSIGLVLDEVFQQGVRCSEAPIAETGM